MWPYTFLVLIIAVNPWTLKILDRNVLILILVVAATICLYLVDQKFPKSKVLSAIFFTLLLLFQYQDTQVTSLNLLDNDEQRVQSLRKSSYTSDFHYVRLLIYKLNLRDYLEGDLNTISSRLQRNFFETIDPNIYFFAGHPRERVWAKDFEKFYFVFIIPFFIGLYKFLQQKNFFLKTVSILIILFLTLIGHKNNLGPFILYPIFTTIIYYGLIEIYLFLKLRKRYVS